MEEENTARTTPLSSPSKQYPIHTPVWLWPRARVSLVRSRVLEDGGQ